MDPRRDESFRSSNHSFQSFQSVRSRVRSFELLKERAFVSKKLFEDVDFPIKEQSLGLPFKVPGTIIWARPHDISRRPRFIANNLKLDVQSAKLGDCCLLTAFSCLNAAPSLIQKCVPSDQEFDEKYAGIFRFRFWRYGEWVEIVIDDRLPTFNGEFLFLRSSDPNEFWVPLFVKAYAKLYGSYGAILTGLLNWSLQDLTGGVLQTLNITESPKNVQRVVDTAMGRSTLLGASIGVERTNGSPGKLPNGLVTGYAYSITGYAELPLSGYSAVLVRLRSPWGKSDWKGSWNEGFDMWKSVSDELKQKLGYGNLAPGEFWMAFSDFANLFTHLEVCHLPPEASKPEPKLQHRIQWTATGAHRQWRRGFNAGGPADSAIFSLNTQFYIELRQSCNVVLSLMQKYKQYGEHRKYIVCGLYIYQCPPGQTVRLSEQHFAMSRPMSTTGMMAGRDNVRFLNLPAGCYVILPVTSQPDVEGRFFLRIFSDGPSCIVRELDDSDGATFIQVDKELDADSLFTLTKRFMLVANRYEEIDAYGLREILSYKNTKNAPSMLCCDAPKEEIHIDRLFLSVETCKAAVAIVDTNMSGKMNYEEFMKLLQKLTQWQSIFRSHAIGNGSVIDSYTLRNVLRLAGFTVSNRTLEALVIRYAAKNYMNLEGFVNSIIKLHVAHQRFKEVSDGQVNGGKMTKRMLQELLHTAIYS